MADAIVDTTAESGMRLKPDKVLRDRFFTPESYQHPAKGHLGLWWEILERYTKAGEWVIITTSFLEEMAEEWCDCEEAG